MSATLSQDSTLWEFLHEQYQLSKSLTRQSVYQYEVAIRTIDTWSGTPVRLCDLSDQLFNRFLQHLEMGTAMAAATVRNRRTHLLTLWHAAYADGLAPVGARNIRKARVPWVPPAAWTHADVVKILDVADELERHYPGERWKLPQDERYPRSRDVPRVPRRVYWGLVIRLAWDTALRLGDLFHLSLSDFSANGKGEVVMRKTRRWIAIKVHAETFEFVKTSFPPRREFIIPTWHASSEYWRREFGKIVLEAGLDGSFKKLRRSSATNVEFNFPGCGSAHLGHASERTLAQVHYLDPRLLIANKPMPQPLRVLEGDAKPEAGKGGAA